MEEGTLSVALYDYRGDGEGQLSFKAGQEIIVLKKLSNGWWKGRLRDEVGFFPGGYVREHASPGSFHDTSNLKKATVLYPYKAQNQGELSLNTGDLVYIHPQDSSNELGWRTCSLVSDPTVIGHYPSSYLNLEEEENTKPVEDNAPQNTLLAEQPKKVKRKSQPPIDSDNKEYRRASTLPSKVEEPVVVKSVPPKKPPPSVPPKKAPVEPKVVPKDNVNLDGNMGNGTKQESDSDAIEKLKQGMIKLQQQSKIAFEEVLARVDEGDKQRENLEFVMRDMKQSAKEDKLAIQKLEHQNKLLYEESKNLSTLLQKEITERKKLEELVKALEQQVKRLG